MEPGALGLVGLIALLAGVCVLWLPVVGWVLAPFLFVFAAILWGLAVHWRRRWTYQCQVCDAWFTVQKDRPWGGDR